VEVAQIGLVLDIDQGAGRPDARGDLGRRRAR
jgi:hypothetical protein